MSIFNSYERLEKSLLKSGRTATATVLLARPESTFSDAHVRSPHHFDYSHWFLELRVTPGTEPEFEVRQTMRVHHFIIPTPGETLDVLYDPEDHTRMIVDPRTAPKTAEEGTARYAAAAHAEMTAGTEGLEHADAASAIEIIRQKQNEALNQAIQQSPAQASELEGILQMQNEAINRAMEQTVNARPEGTPSPSAGPADQVEAALKQLDHLKETGVISDAEYHAKRQQLIDQL